MEMSIQLKLQPLTDMNSKTQIEEPNTNQMRIKCQTTPNTHQRNSNELKEIHEKEKTCIEKAQ